MNNNIEVAISRCEDYKKDNISKALDEALSLIGGLDFIKSGMNVVIKANLVGPMNPNKAATTNPDLLLELSRRIIERGASVTIGDSPGGPFTKLYLGQVYKATGLKDLEEFGIKLNDDFGETRVEFKQAIKCKEIPITEYLLKADVIINCCKLKSHGMMALSCGVKNLYGIVPGTTKQEFHFRYPDYNDFANMLIDLNEFLKPSLTVVDGVVAMEGNGPTAGVPKNVGLIIASKNQYKLDFICAHLIGLSRENVPTIEESFKRGLIPADVHDISCNMSIDDLVIKDFDIRKTHRQIDFANSSKLTGKLFNKFMRSRPMVKKDECIGCEKCKNVCPAKAIIMVNGKPKICKKKCITCFCCQEFCPKGAMKVKKTWLSKLIEKK
ncbi:MAG: DUF362 domain-containing protein [Clostridia bacterium]|nr:DUF362 domain-containing protein [Clostridia bacterium]